MGPAPRPPLGLVPPLPADSNTAGAQGDALDDAFRNYSAYVAYIAARILGRDGDVDDVVQDVFVQAARGLARIRDPGAVKGWLATVTVRVATRQLALRRLRRFLPLWDAGDHQEVAWPGADPEQRATVARLYRLLDTVPDKQRVAWVLRVVEGEPVDEVARLCGCSRATAKRWVQAVQTTVEREMGDE